MDCVRYVGRFAPSPTGPLHLGSLLTAAASFIAARQQGGDWLVRIDDIDPPREAPGAAAAILHALERFELNWDGTVLYQSTRIEAYREIADELVSKRLAYRCECTRSRLRALNARDSDLDRYPGLCREKKLTGADKTIRLRAPAQPVQFADTVQGQCLYSIDALTGDYVIFRRDGLPAYHLAVVLDDAMQGITHIVRGADLLESTPLHLHLQATLGLPAPNYSHLPVVVNAQGQKLSKQTGAAAVALESAADIAVEVLRYLELEPPKELYGASPGELWRWAAQNWDVARLAGRAIATQKDRTMAEDRLK